MINSPVYIFNTEPFKPVDVNFEKYYLLPAGFWDSRLVVNMRPMDIVYYDVNPAALNFKKTLITDWDCSKEQLWILVNDLNVPYAYSNLGIPKQIYDSLTIRERFELNWKFHTDSDVLVNFFAIKESTVDFVLHDIVQNPECLELFIDTSLDNYLWFSNCFEYEHLYPDQLQKDAFIRFKTAMQYMKVFVQGNDPIDDSIINGIINLDNRT